MLKLTDYIVPPVSDTVNAHLLSASTPESDTIPTGAKYVIMTASTIAYFRVGATAGVPGDTTDGTASDTLPPGIPVARALYNAQTLGTINSGTATLTVDSLDGLTPGITVVVAGADTAGANLSTTISSINYTTRVVTLGANANTTVAGAKVTYTPTTISLVSAGTPIVTLAYYR